MSTSDRGEAARPPGAIQVLLSLLLLLLFSPVVLAVGSPAFRPAWLDRPVAGMPPAVLWVLGSIAVFIVLTWIFARMAFARPPARPDAPEAGDR
jgi:hypothetical protein